MPQQPPQSNSRWEVRRGATGWLVLEWIPGELAPTQRGQWPTKRQALAVARFKRDLQRGRWDHVGAPHDG